MNGLPIALTGCKVSPVGLEIGDITFDQWDAAGNILSRCESGVTWWIGDWINYGEKRWEQGRLLRAKSIAKISYKTLANASYLSANVEFSRRRENLSVGHHHIVAPLTPHEQTKWLTLAERGNKTCRRLRAEVAAGRELSDKEFDALCEKNGGVISLKSLCVKMRLWQNRGPKIEDMEMPELLDAHEDLLPFVEADRLIQERMKEIGHATTHAR